MKKPFNKTKVGQFLTKTTTGKLIMGAADTVTGGIVSNAVESTEDHPSGQVNVPKMIGTLVIGAVLIYLVVTGKISIDQAQELKELAQ